MFESAPTRLTEKGLAEVELLLNTCFPHAHHIDRRYLDWLYCQNPQGGAIAYNCHQNGQLVAHFAGIPMRAMVEGREERGLLGVHAASIGQRFLAGAFITALDAVLESAAGRGYSFTYGSVNRLSARVLSRKSTVQNLCSLEARLGIGPAPSSRAGSGCQILPLWDRDRLRWRLNRPGAHYRVRRSGQRDVVFCDTGTPGVVAELGSFSRSLAPTEIALMPVHRMLRLWIGLDHTRRWFSSTYFDLPLRFRPSLLQLMCVDHSQTGRIFDPSRICFQCIDFDLY